MAWILNKNTSSLSLSVITVYWPGRPMKMMRDGLKLWSNGSEAHSSDPEEDEDEEEMLFGENDEESEDMMDLSDLPTSLFACSVHEAVFEEDRQRVSSVCV
ncbi:hypothetical protein PGIGA_G00014310 [Pangasianodon gigas]|uniref:Uncharacterized protein n=1 Tax=Pangasianodon gigas TaxID=30993 RepID=A0ACC5WTH2_PANGG|nr:hypothetical protein [Pangasianodon gigas]